MTDSDRANADALLLTAASHVSASEFAEAHAIYSALLAAAPDNLSAVHGLGNLGLSFKRAGRLAEAVAVQREALAINPKIAEIWVNLGRTLREQGERAGALLAFQRAVVEQPALAEAWCMLSNAQREVGDYTSALASARTALTRAPQLALAHRNEGLALLALGRPDDAAVSFFLADVPHESNPALRAAAGGRVSALVGALSQPGRSALDWLALGQTLVDAQRLPSAAFALERGDDEFQNAGPLLVEVLHALALHTRLFTRCLPRLARPNADPKLAAAVGRVYLEIGKPAQAEALLRQALRSHERDVAVLHNLGTALQRLGKPIEASEIYRRALVIAPDLVPTQLNLGVALTEQADHTEATRVLERALACAPERADLHSNLLFAMHFDADRSAADIFAAHRAFGERFETSHAAPAAKRAPLHGRPLRVGYVSPDLNGHPVGHFLLPVLRHHDPSAVEVYCYSDTSAPDAMTARLATHARVFRSTERLTDAELCAQIRADNIDILVDLAGHTARNRLLVFAQKPAPLQVSWIGYFNTTGLSAVDYRIADGLSLPEVLGQPFTERIFRMPRTANCFEPSKESPDVAPAPHLTQGSVTFGCFNNPAKINRAVVSAFASVLRAVPDSKLILKYGAFEDAALRARYSVWFAAEGVGQERILFEGHTSMRDFLSAFSRIDIALDPFPYSGETTALHTLWMGVPVIALEGDTLVQRLASRVLRLLDLPELVATSPTDFVDRASQLASEKSRLCALRESLRPRMQTSALLDHAGFTRELESAFVTMWHADP